MSCGTLRTVKPLLYIMRTVLLMILFLTLAINSYCQDRYANALECLELDLGFKSKKDSYSISNKPNEKLIGRFKRCPEVFEDLGPIAGLEFDRIKKVKSSEMFTTIWEGKWQIEFQEWEFENNMTAKEFANILNNLHKGNIWLCVNKGGMMWWRENSKFYLLTSRAYFVTYHYKEIEEAILKGIRE